MSIFEIVFYLIVVVASIFLGTYIFFKKKNKEAKVFSVFLFFAMSWVIVVFFFFYLDNPVAVLWLGRGAFSVSLLMMFSLLWFVRLFPISISTKNRNFFPLIGVITILFSLVSLFTPLVVENEIITGIGQRNTIYGPLYLLWNIIFLALTALIIYTLFFQYKKTQKGVEKKQILYLFIGIITSIIFGFITVVFLSFIGITEGAGIVETEKYGVPSALLILFSFLSYTILRHRFMDITVATGKVVTYLFTFLTIGFLGHVMSSFFSYFEVLHAYQVIAIALLAGIFFRPFFLTYESFSSHYLYHSFYSSQKVLGELSEKLTKILDIDELADLTIKTIMDTMKLDRTVILLRDEKTEKFDIKRNFGFKEENGISLVSDSFLTEHLLKTQKPLVYEELSLMIDSTDKEMEKRKIRKLKENMGKIEAALCNLLFSRGKVIGMIVLGEKISKDPYTDQDVNLIDNLCKQISISVENAKLYSQAEDLKNNLEERVEEQVKELKRAYKKLQRIDKAKTEFMSIVSHQLRTPLSIVKGHLSMISEGVYDDDEERKKEILDNVYEANERLIALVNDVLNISRIQSGRVELKKEEVDVVELVRRTTERMMPSASGKDIKVVFHKTDEDVPKIKADVSKTENVVINLIDNAIKYTDEGTVETSVKKEEDYVVIEIKDSGEGMSKEEIEKLFETFSRGDAGKKMWIQGAGLGLYIARQFVEMQGGKVWANSEGEGKGSQFYIKLPIDI